MMTADRRIGVLVAAGRGGRMGGSKQLKPWPSANGPKPLISAAYDAIQPICDEMVIVLGHDAEAVAAALGARKFHRVDSTASQPMFESIRAGLRYVRALDPQATIALQPGDHPEVNPTTLATLLSSAVERPTQAIIPEFANRGGHPVLIPPAIAQVLVDADCPFGLGHFWREHPDLCYRVSVDDQNIHRDVDSLADLPQ